MIIALVVFAFFIPATGNAHYEGDPGYGLQGVASINSLRDGDLVKTKHHYDVYILKILPNGKRFKRLILNPEIFNSYGHLSWGKY